MSLVIDLSGRVALVTGASQGIGAAIAGRLHTAGATVLINHPDLANGTTKADAEALAAGFNRARPASADVVAADVSDSEAVGRMMADIAQSHGGLDILVNNAGILRDRTIAKMSLDEWRDVIDVNLTGVFHVCKYGLTILRNGGSIVNIGSLSARAGFHGQANYSAAKAGVQALTRVLSRETAKRKIRVNAVAPGIVATEMAETIPPSVRSEMIRQIPLGRLGTPTEVADAVLFLCSDLGSYVTGHVLEVDGGWRG